MLATLAPPLGLGGRGGAAVRFVEDDNDKDGDEGAFIVCADDAVWRRSSTSPVAGRLGRVSHEFELTKDKTRADRFNK